MHVDRLYYQVLAHLHNPLLLRSLQDRKIARYYVDECGRAVTDLPRAQEGHYAFERVDESIKLVPSEILKQLHNYVQEVAIGLN